MVLQASSCSLFSTLMQSWQSPNTLNQAPTPAVPHSQPKQTPVRREPASCTPVAAASVSSPEVKATPRRAPISPVKIQPLSKPSMQDIPEDERPIAGRLRRNRPAVNYRASIARFNESNAENGLVHYLCQTTSLVVRRMYLTLRTALRQ